MGLFSKKGKENGLLAFGFDTDGVCVARVTRLPTGKPLVDVALFFSSKTGVSPEVLERIGKDLQASQYRNATLLGGREYQVLAVESPNVQADELRAAVRWRLKDMLDFHIDDATVDVMDIPADKNSTVRNNQMFAIAARNTFIATRQALFARAKINLSVIDIPDTAQRNISALLEPEGRGLAMLYFNADGGLLTVTFGGELYLARRVDVSLAQVEETDTDKRNQVYERITLEVQRSLDHFDRQFSYVNVSKLVLAPLPKCGLHDYLSSNLYMPVDLLDLASVFDLSHTPDLAQPAHQHRHFLTLGAALRFEETVL